MLTRFSVLQLHQGPSTGCCHMDLQTVTWSVWKGVVHHFNFAQICTIPVHPDHVTNSHPKVAIFVPDEA